MKLTGSRTEANLRSAISGEAQAALLYELFEKKARKDGFEQIASIFRETAKNEKAHAEIYFGILKCLHATDQNLFSAVESERHECAVMYPEFARIAREEGFEEIAKVFEMVSCIEAEHQKRFEKFGNLVRNNAVFSKGEEVVWICANCGHRHKGVNPPDLCPVCRRPIAYFAPCEEKDK